MVLVHEAGCTGRCATSRGRPAASRARWRGPSASPRSSPPTTCSRSGRDAYDGPRARGALELDSVSFSYEPDRPGARERVAADRAGHEARPRRPLGGREVDRRRADRPLLRPGLRPRPRRRARRARLLARRGFAARSGSCSRTPCSSRARSPTTSPTESTRRRRRDRGRREGGRRARVHLASCPRATTRSSGRAASGSPAASGSASRSRGRSCATRPS